MMSLPRPSLLRQYLARCPVMPILTVHDVAVAAPLARALVAGGVTVFEVVLRTAAACDAVVAMRAAAPEAVVGMGTLLGPDDVAKAVAAGAAFGVSPGLTSALAAAAIGHGLPLLPGVATPGEVLAARDHGFRELKFFPANGSAGIPFLQALAPVFPDTVFCPTGGIRPADVPAYRKLPNCPTVGGSWLTPQELVTAGDWSGITALARQAAAFAAG
jgi:2-dehydro-3-deoxyphosphogluconate aldolase / (4S)-4-hydroxy-2-oxoglutarate aldolase